MGTTSSEDSRVNINSRELAVVHCSDISIGRDKEVDRYQVENGANGGYIPEFENDGKEGTVISHLVTALDDGSVVATYKKGGEKVTYTLNDPKNLLQARKIKANPVPAKRTKSSNEASR